MFIKILETLNNNKKFPYLFVSILPYAIGDIFEQIQYALVDSKNKKKKLILLTPTILPKLLKYTVANKFIFNDCIFERKLTKYEKYILQIANFFLNIEFLFKRIVILILKNYFYLQIKDKHNFPYLGQYQRNQKNTKNQKIPFIKIEKKKLIYFNLNLPNKHISLCEKIFKNLEINNNLKNICIHIRDSSYHNDVLRRPYRNPNIENYSKTIEYLCDNNFNVFRMGMVAKQELQIKKKNFYDLPFLISANEMEYFQFYLIKKSELFIGTESGPQFISWFLNIPTLYTNVARFFYTIAPNKNSRYIFRKFFFKKKNKIISYKEYINLPFLYHNINFVDEGVKYIENTSQEILDATKEMLQNIRNKNWNLSSKQKEINNFLNSRLMQMYDEYNKIDKGKNLIDQWDNINIIKNSLSNYGSACNSVLDNYK